MSVAVRWEYRQTYVVESRRYLTEDSAGRGFERTATDTVALPLIFFRNSLIPLVPIRSLRSLELSTRQQILRMCQ